MPHELEPDTSLSPRPLDSSTAAVDRVATIVLDVLERHSNYLDRRPHAARREQRLERIRAFVRTQSPVPFES